MIKILNGKFAEQNGTIVKIGCGVNDTVSLVNIIQTWDHRWWNKIFGSSGEANNGSETEWIAPSDANDLVRQYKYWCNLFFNLAKKSRGRTNERIAYRVGGHDPQAIAKMLAMWDANPEGVKSSIKLMLDAAAKYGVLVLITLGGFSDPSTASQAYDMFDATSARYLKHSQMAAAIADVCYGHPAILGIELLNEPDFYTVVKNYWLVKYPAGKTALLDGYASWQTAKVQHVKSLQTKPGVLISMAVAVDSNLYCDPAGNAAWDWLSEINSPNMLLKTQAGLDFCNIHFYINSSDTNTYNVWTTQKVPAFNAMANALGKPLVVGETGKLWYGGTYYDVIDDRYWALEKFNSFFMIRWWDPKDSTAPLSYPDNDVVPDDGGTTTPPSGDDSPTTVKLTATSGVMDADGSSVTTALGNAYMGKVAYDGTTLRVFYGNGTHLGYEHVPGSSITDPAAWSGFLQLVADGIGNDWTMTQDGANIYTIRGKDVATLYFNKGTLNADRTITLGTESDAQGGGTSMRAQSIITDSAGALIYAYLRDGHIWVNKMSSTASGAWASDGGWPKQVTTVESTGWRAQLQYLPGGKFFVLYGRASQLMKGRVWNGSAFDAEETLSLSNLKGYCFSMTSDGQGNIAFAYQSQETADKRLRYRTRAADGTLSAAEIDVAGVAVGENTAPLITLAPNGSHYVWWVNHPTANHVYCRLIASGVAGEVTDVYTDPDGIIIEDMLNIMPSSVASTCFLAYMSKTAKPYRIKVIKGVYTESSTGGGGGTDTGLPPLMDDYTMSNFNIVLKAGQTLVITVEGAAPSGSTGSDPSTPEEDYKFLVTYEAARGKYVIKAKDGAEVNSGTQALPIIQYALNTLTSGRTEKETVKCIGNFPMSGFIEMPSYAKLYLEGKFTQTSTGVSYLVNASGKTAIEFAGGEYDRSGGNQEVTDENDPFHIMNCTDVILRDLIVHDSPNNNFGIASSKVSMFNVEAYNAGNNLCVMYFCSDCLIDACHFYDGQAGICFYAEDDGIVQHLDNNTVRNTTVERTSQSGIAISPMGAEDVCNNNLLEGNTLIDCGADGTDPGISMGYGSHYATNSIVRNNTVYETEACAAAGGVGGGINMIGSNCTLTGNNVHDTTDVGINFHGSGNIVSNNRVTNVRSTTSPAVQLVEGSNNQITNNTLQQCQEGIVLYDPEVQGNNNRLTYNNLEDIPGNVVRVDAGYTNTVIENNVFTNTGDILDNGTGTTGNNMDDVGGLIPSYNVLVEVAGSTYAAKLANGTPLTSGSNAATVINAAIAALTQGRTAKEAVKCVGDFVLTAPIRPANYTTVQLEGKVTRGANVNMVYGSGVTQVDFVGGEWDGNQAVYSDGTVDGFVFENSSHVTIRGADATSKMNIHGTTYHPIFCYGSDHVAIQNVEVHHNGNYAAGDAYRAPGVMMIACSDCTIEGNYVHDTSKGGVYFYSPEGAGSGFHNDRNVVQNNLVERTWCSGIEVAARGISDVCTGNIVRGNTVIDGGMDGEHPGIYIGWYGSGDGVNYYLARASAATVEGNEVYETGTNPTSIGGIYLYADDSTCNGNNVHDVAAFGIACRCDRNTFDGNTIARAAMGAVALAGTSDSEVTNGVFTACGDGVLIVDGLEPGNDNNHISGNRFENMTNFVLNITTADASGTQFDHNTLVGNHAISDAGTGTVVSNNTES